MKTNNYIKYFPGLNGLRFIAAVLVFFHHTEQHKFWMGIPSLWMDRNIPGVSYPLIVYVIDNIGHQARVIFFVLSGFLVTYMFLVEKAKTDKISWKKFQIRRALRLYPVYYLVAIFAFFVLPHIINIGTFNESLRQNFTKEIVIFGLMLPNLSRLLPPVMGASQFWSVGVQEQFYLTWPVAVKLFSKYFMWFLISFLLLKFGLEFLLIYITPLLNDKPTLQKIFSQLLFMLQLFQVEQMAVGGIAAYILFKGKEKILNIIYNPIVHISVAIVFITLLFFDIHFTGYTLFSGFIAVVLIMNISLNKKFYFSLDTGILNYLGNLSFGMYAYHTLCLAITISVLTNIRLHETNFVLFNILFYSLSFTASMILSVLSYRYFEAFFLKFKEKFKEV
ncbi:MAG: acyltransferase [Ignavibacteriae bacterium]|nr:acyltransferase [Ignavibacteriota bacterium]